MDRMMDRTMNQKKKNKKKKNKKNKKNKKIGKKNWLLMMGHE
jgi:hypothetical protein